MSSRSRLAKAVAAAILASGVVAAGAGGSPKFIIPGFLIVRPGAAGAGTQFQVIPTPATPLLNSPVPKWSVAVYIPAGYRLDSTLLPGTRVGTVGADGKSSELTVADPARFFDDPCAPGIHAAVWTSQVVRIFVDPTAGDETARGAYRLSFCESAIFAFRLDGILRAPARHGLYVWRAFVSLHDPNTDLPYPHGTYEERSVVPVPHILLAHATYDRRAQRLTVSGEVVAGDGPEASAFVTIVRPSRPNAPALNARTEPDGTFTVTEHAVQRRVKQVLDFDAGALRSGPCTGPALAPAGCTSERSSATELTFKATIPKR